MSTEHFHKAFLAGIATTGRVLFLAPLLRREGREDSLTRGSKLVRMGMRAFVLFVVVAAPLAFGCVAQGESQDARVEFHADDTLGITCDSALSTWSVTNRETSEIGTALCDQPVLFVNLTPGQTYTFDIQGHVGSELCFQGSCDVTAEDGTTSVAKCGSMVEKLCDGSARAGSLSNPSRSTAFDERAQTE